MFGKKKLVSYFYSGVDRHGKHHSDVIYDTDMSPKELRDKVIKDAGGHLTAFNQV